MKDLGVKGSLRERQPGNWEPIVHLPRDPETGLRKQLSRTHYGTKREAQRALAAFVTEVSDRHGNVTRAVAGYDATFSAPKPLSVLWALTGDDGLAECHDRAVNAAVAMVEKFGSTTRIRSNGTRLHPDAGGLTAAVFRQSTSRGDDPQLHTHVVISAKVQTDDGRWWALDARVLKRHQQTFGYVYQSVLRTELTARYGVAFDEIVNGQAEIAGVPAELLHQFSKRAHVIAVEMDERIADFRRSRSGGLTAVCSLTTEPTNPRLAADG